VEPSRLILAPPSRREQREVGPTRTVRFHERSLPGRWAARCGHALCGRNDARCTGCQGIRGLRNALSSDPVVLTDCPTSQLPNPWGSSRGQVVVGETCTERFHVCPARSIHRDTGVKRRERPSHILGSGTLGEVAVILGQATSASARFSPREAREPGHARATRPGR
jgi:hypothetical protein